VYCAGAATSDPKRRWAECGYGSRWWADGVLSSFGEGWKRWWQPCVWWLRLRLFVEEDLAFVKKYSTDAVKKIEGSDLIKLLLIKHNRFLF
jgi:hypothetical protein